jgi:Leucine-rich repeat (LRR) protein
MAKQVMHKKLARLEQDPAAIRKVDLSEVPGLRAVPNVVRECVNAESVDVSFTDVSTIPDWVLQLPKLRELNLFSCTSLSEQPTNLGLASGLEDLSLQIGAGQQIPSEVFRFAGLKRLVLGGGIAELPVAIANLRDLQSLELLMTQITSLPGVLQELPKLARLKMFTLYSFVETKVQLDIESILGTLEGCKKLEGLSLSDCGIAELPASIGQLQGLKSLQLSSNLLADYPDSLHDLVNLVELDLGVNQLARIHPGFGKLKKLKVLKLNSNWKNACDFSALFAEIDQLQALRNLQMWSCQSVSALPDSISTLAKLQELDVDNNLLSELPESLFTMTQLKKLRVSTNKLPAAVTDRLLAALPATKVVV